MRRRMGSIGVGVLVAVLLAGCGQPVVSPTAGRDARAATATVGASPTWPGTPGTPVVATPGTPTRVASPTGVSGSPTDVTASPAVGADPALRALLAALPETREIVIEDDWNGLSQDAPIESHYRLARQGDAFVGPARGVRGGYGNKISATTAEVTVPAEAARAFLALLAQTPVRTGEYKPAIAHTDDYPSISIVLETPAGRLVFATGSNTKGYVPWFVGTETAKYVSDSDTPYRALELLDLSLDGASGKVVSPEGSDPLVCRTPVVPGDPTGAPARPTGAPDVNMAQQYGLAGLTALSFDRGVKLTDPQQIAAFVALFDRPVALIEQAYWSDYDTIELGLFFTERDYFWLLYNPYLDLIYWQRDPPARNKPIHTVAPPGFRELVLKEVCGR